MSDASQGPGWWQASDGKWYPPESHPSAMTNPAPADPGPRPPPPAIRRPRPTRPTPPTRPPHRPHGARVGPGPPDQAGYAQPGAAQAPYGQAPGPAPYGQSPYGQPPRTGPYGQPRPTARPPYGQPAYGQAPYGQAPGYPADGRYGYGPPRPTAWPSPRWCCGILGFICFLGPSAGGVAIVLGVSARRKIRESGGAEKGDGLALAGIILGAVFVALQIGFFALALIGSTNATAPTTAWSGRRPTSLVVDPAGLSRRRRPAGSALGRAHYAGP